MSDVNSEPWNNDWTEQGIKDWNREIIKEFRANRGKVGGAYEGGDLLLLTTTGARSGKRHTVPLAYLTHGERLIVIGGSHNPAWYYNVMTHQEVTVEVGTETFEGTAAIAIDDAREQLWTWARNQWPGVEDFQAQATGPLPVITLQR